MSPRHDSNDLPRIAAEATWVRRLAVALAHDVHAGEDIAQDALHAEVAALRKDMEELALYTRALSSLLVEKGIFTHDKLIGRLEKLEGEDRRGDERPA